MVKFADGRWRLGLPSGTRACASLLAATVAIPAARGMRDAFGDESVLTAAQGSDQEAASFAAERGPVTKARQAPATRLTSEAKNGECELRVASSTGFGKEHGCDEVWISETGAGGKAEFLTIWDVQGASIWVTSVLQKSYKSESGVVACVSKASQYRMDEQVEYYYEDKWIPATVNSVRGQILLIHHATKTGIIFGLMWVNSDLPNTVRKKKTDEATEARRLESPDLGTWVEQTQRAPHLSGHHEDVEVTHAAVEGASGNHDHDVDRLMEMGFGREQAEQAMKMNPGNLDMAVAWILASADNMGPVEPVQKTVVQDRSERPREVQVQPHPQPAVKHESGECSITNGEAISHAYPCVCGTALCDKEVMEIEDDIDDLPIIGASYEICNATANSCQVSCVDSNVETDGWGDGCVKYFHDRSLCGLDDDLATGFVAASQCCACGGGEEYDNGPAPPLLLQGPPSLPRSDHTTTEQAAAAAAEEAEDALPEGWSRIVDGFSMEIYYFNQGTDEVRFDRPKGAPPQACPATVRVSGSTANEDDMGYYARTDRTTEGSKGTRPKPVYESAMGRFLFFREERQAAWRIGPDYRETAASVFSDDLLAYRQGLDCPHEVRAGTWYEEIVGDAYEGTTEVRNNPRLVVDPQGCPSIIVVSGSTAQVGLMGHYIKVDRVLGMRPVYRHVVAASQKFVYFKPQADSWVIGKVADWDSTEKILERSQSSFSIFANFDWLGTSSRRVMGMCPDDVQAKLWFEHKGVSDPTILPRPDQVSDPTKMGWRFNDGIRVTQDPLDAWLHYFVTALPTIRQHPHEAEHSPTLSALYVPMIWATATPQTASLLRARLVEQGVALGTFERLRAWWSASNCNDLFTAHDILSRLARENSVGAPTGPLAYLEATLQTHVMSSAKGDALLLDDIVNPSPQVSGHKGKHGVQSRPAKGGGSDGWPLAKRREAPDSHSAPPPKTVRLAVEGEEKPKQPRRSRPRRGSSTAAKAKRTKQKQAGEALQSKRRLAAARKILQRERRRLRAKEGRAALGGRGGSKATSWSSPSSQLEGFGSSWSTADRSEDHGGG